MTSLITLLVTLGAAQAQVTPTGEFSGEWAEDMESLRDAYGVFPELFVLEDGATILRAIGGSMHTTTGWGYYCSIYPYAGTWFGAATGGTAQYEFASPVNGFGGYFGTNSGWDILAQFEFVNSAGAVVHTEMHNMGSCGTWQWLGWNFGTPIAQVRVTNLGAGVSGHIMMDNIQVGPGGPALCAPGTASAAGVEPCGVCPAGTYTDAPGAFECSICENGTLNPDDGASSCEVPVIENDPVIPGFGTSVRITGLEPGARGYLMRGTSIGAGPCPGYLDGACWDITSPVLARSALADGSGVATFNFDVPIGLSPGTNFYVQAATMGPLGPVISDPLVITVD